MKIFLTSDWHFSHNNIFGEDGFVETRKNFQSKEEMNNKIIDSINAVATSEDVLYHLGDIGFGKPSEIFEILERINPRMELIAGNHDNSKLLKYINRHNYAVDKHGNMRYMIHQVGVRLKKNGKVYLLSHYPLGLGDKRVNLRNFCGHIHDTACKGANILNVGVDSPEINLLKPFGTPIEFDSAIVKVDNKWWGMVHNSMTEEELIRYGGNVNE